MRVDRMFAASKRPDGKEPTMDYQHNYPSDDADELRLILLQLDEAGRQEVYAMIRELAAKSDAPEPPTTVSALLQEWNDVRREAEGAPDDAALDGVMERAFQIEQRAVGLPLASAQDVLALIVMTTDADNEGPRSTMDALVARAHAEVSGN